MSVTRLAAALLLAASLALDATGAHAQPGEEAAPPSGTGDVSLDALIDRLLAPDHDSPELDPPAEQPDDDKAVVYEEIDEAGLDDLVEAARRITPLPRNERR